MGFFFHELKNHINRDPLSDWFAKISNKYNSYHKDDKNSFQIELEKQKEHYQSTFIDHFKDESFFYENINHDEILFKIKNKEECIIYKGNLLHSKYDIHVKPDIIIHRSIFKRYFPDIMVEMPEYIIIDIVFKILHFNSERTDLLNQGNIYYHKCKMFLASDSIGIKNTGYLFGKEYRHRNNPLIKQESIGFFPFTEELTVSIIDGIKWLQRLNKYYDKWLVYPKPSIKELYPNMNRKDGDWTNEKRVLAELIKEITLVWNISFNKRCMLLDRGITTWDDPILLSNIYPYNVRDTKREYIQNKMININSQDEIDIEPRRIKNYEFIKIIKNQHDSIILDIESVVDLKEKENYFDDIKSVETPRICIIGTILNKDDYIFKDFTIKYLSNEEEKKIIEHWLNYLNHNFSTKITVYHWGNAEKVYLDYMINKYPDIIFPEFVMIDLLYYFKLEPINIKGCFGYGLKEIVKQLYNLNLIDNKWQDDTDGLDATIQIMKTSELAHSKNIPIKRFTEIRRIIYYNYMDCRVVVDILKMLVKMT